MRLALLAVVAVFVAGDALAADDEAKVEALERVWADALVAKDIAALDYLLHPEFRLVSLFLPSTSGSVERSEYVARQLADPRWKFEAMMPVGIEVEVRGEIAIAMVEMEVGWPGGLVQPSEFRFTDVWARDIAGWRVISRFSEYR